VLTPIVVLIKSLQFNLGKDMTKNFLDQVNSTLHKGIRHLCCEHGHLMHVRFHIPSGPYERGFCSFMEPLQSRVLHLGGQGVGGSVLGLLPL